jgi:hypothetical protein
MENYRRPIKEYVKSLGRRLGLVKVSGKQLTHRELMINSQIFKEKYLPVLSPEDSVLISLIKDDDIRAYVRKLFVNCNKGHLKDLKHVNQLINLELFIRNVHNR